MFDGETFDYSQDFERLKTALDRVAHMMQDGKWRTLAQIARRCRTSESGASARLRDLRKPKFQQIYGRLNVHSVRESGGLWKYRVERATEPQQAELF